ncbi:MAG: hypothetical protein WD894_19285 [Pirellulales bacterium]
MSISSSQNPDLLDAARHEARDASSARAVDGAVYDVAPINGVDSEAGFEEMDEATTDDSSDHDYSSYRTLSPAAVLSCLLGLGSFAAFLDWWLIVLPVAGLALGMFALRRIAARSDELAGRLPALAGVVLSAACLVGSQVTLWYIRLTEVPDGHVRMTYDDLQPDPRVINQIVPPAAEELHGQRVFIKGYVLAGNRKDGIRSFILVRDQGDCCFGGNPKLTDRILVQLKGGQAFTYTDKLQKLIGRFQIRPGQAVDVEGNVVYQLDDAELL